jgi:hypothetical protein
MRSRVRWLVVAAGVAGLTLTVAGFGASAPAGSAIAPGAILDQSNPYRPPACMFRGWSPAIATSWYAQSFTAGITGTLTDVVLPLWGNTTPITVAISPVDGSGQPLVATPLASASLAFSPVATPTDLAVSFPDPAQVEAGKQYAIVLSAPNDADPSPEGTFVGWAADDGSSVRDPNGTPCADGAYAPGRAWGLDFGTVANGAGADSDAFFQTYVLAASPPVRRVSVSVKIKGAGRVTGGGFNCPARCKETIAAGTRLTLRETPARGYRFAGWGAACRGLGVCTLRPTAAVKVTATFRKRSSRPSR